MSDLDLCYMTASEALRRFRKRTLSPVELMKALTARTEVVNPQVNAFTFRFPERALKAARAAERRYAGKGEAPRPLEGIPVAIKDLHAIQGEITTRGSHLGGQEPDQVTHPMVRRLLEAGAILYGRTTSPEFGAAFVTHSPRWGITRNPWNLERTPGGSGGGAGAALAAGMVTIADGSDYGGSIRVPAACCGVLGYKPPFGRNPGGSWPDTLLHFGPLARSVADAVLMQRITAGQHPSSLYSLPDPPALPNRLAPIKGWRIAWSLDLGFFSVAPDVKARTLAALKTFEALGCTVEEVKLDWDEGIMEAFAHHTGPAFAADLEELSADKLMQLSRYVRGIRQAARGSRGIDVGRSMSTRARMYERLAPILHRHDLFVCPTLARTAVAADYDSWSRRPLEIAGKRVNPEFGWTMAWPFNMLGPLPVASVPSGLGEDGLPTAIQLVARPYDDLRVLRAAADFERASPWLDRAERRPPI
jgi:Asp-tRNA(Asn)/Glu-tRNA(Gln) amidotransferase A subunit family amidase